MHETNDEPGLGCCYRHHSWPKGMYCYWDGAYWRNGDNSYHVFQWMKESDLEPYMESEHGCV
jgi:hypothetical protein